MSYNTTARYAMPEAMPTSPDWLNVNRMHVNLRRAYLATTETERKEGLDWYPSALHWVSGVAHAYDVSTDQAVAALALMSPRVRWNRNKAMLVELLATGDTTGLRGNIEAARRVLMMRDPLTAVKGKKTNAFARNILGDYQPVTVDRWAARMADSSLEAIITRKGLSVPQYDQIARAYQQASKAQGLAPAELQAVLWVAARKTGA